jgi:hypothetical protein
MLIIFAGAIGRLPFGGHAWIDMQYLLGLRALGHEVYYLEECGEGSWVHNWETEELTTDLDYPTSYVRDCLEPYGFGDRWIYRAGDEWRGMEIDAFFDLSARADLLMIRGVSMDLWRPEYDRPRKRAFLDVDPGFTQIKVANGHSAFKRTLDRCQSAFTIGQRVGEIGCSVPLVGRHWHKTVSPVFLPAWPFAEHSGSTHFTSFMQWRSYKEVSHDGARYGNKDREFPKFLNLPLLTSQPFRIGLTGGAPRQLSQCGWDVVPGWVASRTPADYQSFIQESRAEFGVAKHGYVAMRSGWFSDRSVCYLASGRPVLIQETGVSDWLPTGAGVVTFRDRDEALRGVDAINADYQCHRQAARQLAEECFSTESVLPPLLEAAMAGD